MWAIAEVVQARLGGIKIARQQQRDDSQIANTVEPDLDEGSCQSAALPEEWIRADQIQPLQLRRLRGQKIEDLVLPCATLDDVAGIRRERSQRLAVPRPCDQKAALKLWSICANKTRSSVEGCE